MGVANPLQLISTASEEDTTEYVCVWVCACVRSAFITSDDDKASCNENTPAFIHLLPEAGRIRDWRVWRENEKKREKRREKKRARE